MTDGVPGSRHIPAEIKRLVLVEAGHCCAIPTCQLPATQFAHIEPFATVKKHTADNKRDSSDGASQRRKDSKRF